jgi:hypothetical protein
MTSAPFSREIGVPMLECANCALTEQLHFIRKTAPSL